MKKNRLWIILIPIVLIIVLCVGLGVWYMLGQGNRAYEAQVSEARSCAAAGEFESAITAYEAAINMDDSRPEAYEGLIKLYLTLSKPGDAREVLGRFQNTNPDDHSLAQYEEKIQSLEDQQAGSEAIKTEVDTVPTLNEDLIRFFSGATFSQLERKYGPSTVATENGSVTANYGRFVCYFDQDNVYSNGKPHDDARPTSISMLDLSMLFVGLNGRVSVSELQASFGIQIVLVENTATFMFDECEIKFMAENGALTGTDAWNTISIPQIKESVEKSTLSGNVIDATTGLNVTNYTIGFRTGSGVESGDYIVLLDNVSGEYEAELEPGTYTAEVSCTGYITEYFEVNLYDWFVSDVQNFTISPILNPGEIRIVLEWEEEPRDLDSHLFGTSSEGKWEHISFMDKFSLGVASLDVDDTNGYGPETTTITDMNGSYTYVVKDYQNTGKMAQTAVTVKIYESASAAPTIVTVPADVVNEWEVCTIINGVVTITNVPYTGGDL